MAIASTIHHSFLSSLPFFIQIHSIYNKEISFLFLWSHLSNTVSLHHCLFIPDPFSCSKFFNTATWCLPYCRSESICNSAMFFLQSPSSKLHLKFLDFSSIEPHKINSSWHWSHLNASHSISHHRTRAHRIRQQTGPSLGLCRIPSEQNKICKSPPIIHGQRQSSMANANHQWPTPIIHGQRQTGQNKSANQHQN